MLQSDSARCERRRCAIYTRKSVPDGLERNYNSLESQRDVCAAYIRTKRHEGWIELAERYDDGGYSGGTLVRPAMQKVIADVERGAIDVVVVYKIDRLTRSLPDFIRLIDLLDRFEVSFVSVTQSFDTRDSMGRLILNVLLTFAQFEREMLIDRIRDKMAAMKRAGRWTGGSPPFGYDVVDGRLVINQVEAATVRSIFERYLELRNGTALVSALRQEGIRSKSWTNRFGEPVGGKVISRGMVYALLSSRLYIGEISHLTESFPGLHEAIIPRDVWDRAQRLQQSRKMIQPLKKTGKHLLSGFLFDGHGRRMGIAGGIAKGKEYHYYRSDECQEVKRQGHKRLRAGADDLESLIVGGIATFLRDRPTLAPAIASLGYYDREIERLIQNGPAAARRLEGLCRREMRGTLEALIQRIELDRARVTIMVRLAELGLFLAWDGVGRFRTLSKGKARRSSRIHCISVAATAVRAERYFTLPVPDRGPGPQPRPNKGLVDLLALARRAAQEVFGHRDRSIEEVAARMVRTPSFVHRLLRLNYLAPDIIAAIADGRQPPQLTRKRLAYASLPTDWAQQRALFGFPPHEQTEGISEAKARVE